jgi:hypothetical protein
VEGSKSDSQKNFLIGGGVVVVAAVVIGAVALSSGDKKAGGTCTLGVGGVAAMAEGLRANRNPGVIAGELLAGYGATRACESAVKTFAAEPDTSVPIKLETTDGTTAEEETTGSQLVEPAPAKPPSSGSLYVDCIGSSSNFAYQLCVNGVIPPP